VSARRSPRSLCWRGLGALTLVLAVAGCADDEPYQTPAPAPPPPPPDVNPPAIEQVSIPSWPPLSATSRLEVAVSDDRALASVTASFRGSDLKTVTGLRGVVTFFGSELGEGQGTLTIIARDKAGSSRTRTIHDLVVDFTPPDIELEREAVSPRLEGIDGEVAVWVSDGWVLGAVDLTFLGKTFHEAFPEAYPPTLGKSRDTSRVAFAARDLPVGDAMLEVTARDAAGNARTMTRRLRIDATPPVATIAAPAPGATLQGSAELRVTASDDGPTPPLVDVWVGGARVLTSVPPGSPLRLDTSTLPAGASEIRVIPRDEAGNEGAPAIVAVTIAP